MFPVPTFPNLFHLITEPQRCKETLLQIFVPLKYMHQNQPLFLLLVHNGKGKGQAVPLAGSVSFLSPHPPTPPLSVKGHFSLQQEKCSCFGDLVNTYKLSTLGESVLDTPFNRPPDGHIKARGLLQQLPTGPLEIKVDQSFL